MEATKTILFAVIVSSVLASLSVGAGELSPATADNDLSQIAAMIDVAFVRAPVLKETIPAEAPPDLSKWSSPLSLGHLDGRVDNAIPVKTEGFLACDKKSLHIAVRCFDGDMEAVPSGPVASDGDVWAKDSVEIFVLPGLDPTKPYFQFAMNPAGSLFDARINDKAWNSGATTRAYRDGSSWTVVLSVPYEAMGLKADAIPTLWRVNLNRSRPARGSVKELDLAWSPTRSKSNHVPSRFGLVYLEGLGQPFDVAAARSFIEQSRKLQIVFRQGFEKDIDGFNAGEVIREDGLGGPEHFLRVKGRQQVTLERNFGAIQGLTMAFAYRTAPHQHGLVVHGNGTKVNATRPGMIQVLGRGLEMAKETCQDADGQSSTEDLGLDAFLFKRPYGH